MASGQGSNVQAILSAINSGQLNAEPVHLICNQPNAGVLDVAQRWQLSASIIPHHNDTRHHHETQIVETLSQYHYDYIVLAGYMRRLTPKFFNAIQPIQPGLLWPKEGYKVVNIHPSLLPAFMGTHAYEKAFQYGVKVSGITIHFVDELVDHGPILAQATFPRLETDTLEDFMARGLALEHQLFPATLQKLFDVPYECILEPTTQRVQIVWKERAPVYES